MREKAIVFATDPTEDPTITYGFVITGRTCSVCSESQAVIITCSCHNKYCLLENSNGSGDCINCFLSFKRISNDAKNKLRNLLAKLNPIILLEMES